MAKEYGWLPAESDGLYWADILKFIKSIKARNLNKAKEQLTEYIMFLQIIHSAEPQKLCGELQRALSGESADDEIGEMDKLSAFKDKPRARINQFRLT